MPSLRSRRSVGHVVPRHFLALDEVKLVEEKQDQPESKVVVRAWSPETGYVVREVQK